MLAANADSKKIRSSGQANCPEERYFYSGTPSASPLSLAKAALAMA